MTNDIIPTVLAPGILTEATQLAEEGLHDLGLPGDPAVWDCIDRADMTKELVDWMMNENVIPSTTDVAMWLIDEATAAYHRRDENDDGDYDQSDYDARYGRAEPIGWGFGGEGPADRHPEM